MTVQLALEGIGVNDPVTPITDQVTELDTDTWEHGITAHGSHQTSSLDFSLAALVGNANTPDLTGCTLQLSSEFEIDPEIV